jgi:hypothetical protein
MAFKSQVADSLGLKRMPLLADLFSCFLTMLQYVVEIWSDPSADDEECPWPSMFG